MTNKEKIINHLQNNKFIVIVLSVFLSGQLVMIHFHEMWRDELQAWLIARAASTPLDMYRNLYYEGHPPLWHGLLYIVTRFTGNPVFMQLLHVGIASAIAYVILRYSPFSRLQKVLLTFSYFIFYEYGVIARNYSLGILFMFLFCALMLAKKKNYLHIGLVLFFAALSNPMTALLVPTMVFFVAIDAAQSYVKGKPVAWRQLVTGGAIAVAGLLLFYKFVKQPPNSGIGTSIGADVRNALATIWQSYIPISNGVVNFWSTNIVRSFDAVIILSVVMLIGAVQYFARNLKVLAFYLFGTVTLLAFFDLKNLGSLRHQGFLFIILIMGAWLVKGSSQNKKQPAGFRVYQSVFLTLILSAQFIGMLVAVNKDIKLTFSQAKVTANYIRYSQQKDLPLVGLRDYTTTPVAGYLDKEAYFPKSNDTQGSFVRWIDSPILSLDESLRRTREIYAGKSKQVLVLSNERIDTRKYRDLQFVAAFDGPTVVPEEVYYMYTFNL